MSTIYLAGNRVPANFNYTHLQLVSGGQELEVQAPPFYTIPLGGKWVYENRSHDGLDENGDPHTNGIVNSVITPEYYNSIAIDIGDRDSSEVWQLLERIQLSFETTSSIDYNLFSQNSNSYINSLLYMIGININSYLLGATPPAFFVIDEFNEQIWYAPAIPVGVDHNVLLSPETSPTFNLSLTTGNDTLRTGFGNDTIHGIEGDDFIYTFEGNDVLYGGEGNDYLFGGLGNDTLFGDDENDYFVGDEGADELYGGSGKDLVDYRLSTAPVIINLVEGVGTGGYAEGDKLTSIEAVIGTAGDDTFTVQTSEEAFFLSGGAGADHFNITTSNNGMPVFVWGGAGDDVVNIATNSDRPVGIMTVNVTDLTEDNFHLLDISTMGLPADFDWGQIDVVLVNAEVSDRVYFGEVELRAEEHNMIALDHQTIGIVYFEGVPDAGQLDLLQSFIDAGYSITFDEISTISEVPEGPPVTQRVVQLQFEFETDETYLSIEHNDGELYYYVSPVQGSFLSDIQDFEIISSAVGRHSVIGYEINDERAFGFFIYGIPGSPYHIGPTVEHQTTFPDGHTEDWVMRPHFYYSGFGAFPDGYMAPAGGFTLEPVNGNTTAGEWYFGYITSEEIIFSTSEAIGEWFLVGGEFHPGSGPVGNGTITVSIGSPGVDVHRGNDDTQNSGNTQVTTPQSAHSFRSNSNGSSGPVIVNGFNASGHILSLSEGPINPSALPDGLSLAQTESGVAVYREDLVIVELVGVQLSDWISASQGHGIGSTQSEAIQGTVNGDLIASGSGHDTISAGAGNDVIVYHSGNDLIRGDNSAINSGFDTLDLSQYAAADVSFRVSGHDVLVTTPDGTIRLEYQVRYELGHARSNIEGIIFSDGSLNEAGIKGRALADQATAGNDVITGTIQDDQIRGLAGNDTLVAGGGNDTIYFDSGDDVIVGHATVNLGHDTLDLSQYAANEVSFRVSGHDVVITAPHGTIRLEYQVRYELGHTRSNIEEIIFSDGSLDEAGIKGRALSDQATAGNDVIKGTIQSDVLDGGAGNDTITGGAGADVFIFGLGSGQDRITDFSLTEDLIRFNGHVFSDLTITQSGANTLVALGVDDVITLAGITASNITTDHFEFI